MCLNQKQDFKIGDWIILKEDFVSQNIGIEYFQKDFKNRFYRERKIKIITYINEKNKEPKKEVFIDVEGKNTLCRWKNFRLATENEIRTEKVKSIFVKPRMYGKKN